MHSIYFIQLQIPETGQPSFVLKVGLLVILLSSFIIVQTIINRQKKNRLILERDLLRESFDSQLLLNRIAVQEATFESLGKELHDNLGQLLSTAKMLIGITERNLNPPPPTLLSANETLNQAIYELRSLSKFLNREWLQQFNLYENLQPEIDRINTSGKLFISFKNNPLLPLTAEEQFILFRLLQEGIQNVVKHAEATFVSLKISCHKNILTSSIEDDGKGFDVQQKKTGIGINNMNQRAKSLGGKIQWQSSGAGTKVIIEFPLKHLVNEI